MGAVVSLQQWRRDPPLQVASPGISPYAPGVAAVLFSFLIPTYAFGRIKVQAAGAFAANTAAKTLSLNFGAASATPGATIGAGGTVIATARSVNGGAWALAAQVIGGQLAIHTQAQVGAAVAPLMAPQALAYDETTALWIALTANVTAVADVVANFFEVQLPTGL
jgi:hypothetical protein